MNVFAQTILAASLALLPVGALADSNHGHGTGMAAESGTTDYDKAMMGAHMKMMKDMEMKPSGDPDKDFVKMMIPHHQGAIDMAKVQLKFGKDPELRALAEKIIADQQKEIAQMRAWHEAK